MFKLSSESQNKKLTMEKITGFLDNCIGYILAIITIVTIPEAILGLTGLFWNNKDEANAYLLKWKIGAVIVAVIIGIIIGWAYRLKFRIFKKSFKAEYEYRREKKINSINKVVFDALYNSNSAKIAEIFRYTYGKVSEWNPINYRDNVLIYDVHEQIRSILKSLESCIINIDPTRLNDRNVSVGLVYCYPTGDYSKCKLPLDKSNGNGKEDPNYDWKLITSGIHQETINQFWIT